MHTTTLPSAPGALLGYRKTGQPIYLAAGGDGTGDPGGPPTDPPAPPADPPAPPAPPADPPKPPAGEGDITTLPEWAQKQIKDLRAEAGKSRTTAKQQAADEARKQLVGELAKALGIQTGDEPPDPAKLAEQLTEAQVASVAAHVELAVFRTAGRTGANPDLLLDSREFEQALTDAVEVGPDDPKFVGQVEAAIKAFVEKNPRFKAGQAPGRSGADITPPGGKPPERPKSLAAAIGAAYHPPNR